MAVGEPPQGLRVALPPGGRAAYLLSSFRSWFEGYRGYRRIQGALANLGHEVARGTIANILKEHGLEPAPERNRKTTWKDILASGGDCSSRLLHH